MPHTFCSVLPLCSFNYRGIRHRDETGMAGLLGKIEQYDPEEEDWPEYIERLEYFFKANGIVGEDNGDRRHATFLTMVGPAAYKLSKVCWRRLHLMSLTCKSL